MCQRGLQGEHGGPLGCPLSVGRGKAAGPGAAVTASDCPQVELRSYVSEPELATFSGDTAPSSLGLVGSESRYQTLPGRGLSGSMSRLQQSSTIAPYVTLRRGLDAESSKMTYPVSRP